MMEKQEMYGAVRGDEQALRNAKVARGIDSAKRVRNMCSEFMHQQQPLTEEEQLYYDLLASGMSTRQAKRKMLKMARKKK